YFLGLTYDKLGNRDKAVEMIQKVASLNPDNEEVKKVMDNLKNGRNALDGLSSNTPAPVVDNNPPALK
ncbi:MAG: tetratricopeptide repeat protein, partial [Candidatus Nealsonbacteria bacterium]|nr:tetratricopeptide repeat protein [Candidatus Nealsonbacteria bacterium]